MKRYQKFLGLPLVYAGVAELAICFVLEHSPLFQNTSDKMAERLSGIYNCLLLFGLLLVIVGIISYTVLRKRQSNY